MKYLAETLILLSLCIIQYMGTYGARITWRHNGKAELVRHRRGLGDWWRSRKNRNGESSDYGDYGDYGDEYYNTEDEYIAGNDDTAVNDYIAGSDYIAGTNVGDGNGNSEYGLNHEQTAQADDSESITHGSNGRHATEVTAQITTENGTVVELKLNKLRSMKYNIETFAYENGEFVAEPVDEDKDYGIFVDKKSGSVFVMECDDVQCRPCALFNDGTDAYALDPFDTPEHASLPKSDEGRVRNIVEITRTAGIGWNGELLDIPVTARKRREALLDDNMLKHLLRRRRNADETSHVVELIMIADYSEYNFWLERSGNDSASATMALKLYFILLTNMMDMRYENMYNMTGYIDIKFMINAVYKMATLADSGWITNSLIDSETQSNRPKVNVEKALDDFTLWLVDVKGNFPPHDHVMGVSRYDMTALDDSGEWNCDNLGAAWTGTMCKAPQFSVSLIEDAGFGLVDWIAAHELGHSLSSGHDIPGCGDFHVMSSDLESPTEGSESSPFELSICTVLAIEQHINSLNHNCMLDHSYDSATYQSFKSNLAPGVYLSVDTQCELAYGNGSSRCDAVSPGICSEGTYCWHPGDPNYCYILYVREGTVCDRNKRCHRGKCENSTVEMTTCPPRPSVMLEMSADTSNTQGYTTVLPGDHTPTFSTTMSQTNEEDIYC